MELTIEKNVHFDQTIVLWYDKLRRRNVSHCDPSFNLDLLQKKISKISLLNSDEEELPDKPHPICTSEPLNGEDKETELNSSFDSKEFSWRLRYGNRKPDQDRIKENIKENGRNKVILGYVYVVTTNQYKQKSIFKIGFTTDLNQRLKNFNATRIEDDLFFCVHHWRTIHYSKLEAFLHAQLHEYRLNNEFFKVSLSLVESAAEEFARINGPMFFYDDVVLINKELFEVQWIPSKLIFIYNDETPSPHASPRRDQRPLDEDARSASKGRRTKAGRGISRIKYVNESGMYQVVMQWLSCVDVYGLLQFTCSDVITRLVELLKEESVSGEVGLAQSIRDMSNDFRKLNL